MKVEVFEVWPVLESRNSANTEDGHPTALGRMGVSRRLCRESGFCHLLSTHYMHKTLKCECWVWNWPGRNREEECFG